MASRHTGKPSNAGGVGREATGHNGQAVFHGAIAEVGKVSSATPSMEAVQVIDRAHDEER